MLALCFHSGRRVRRWATPVLISLSFVLSSWAGAYAQSATESATAPATTAEAPAKAEPGHAADDHADHADDHADTAAHGAAGHTDDHAVPHSPPPSPLAVLPFGVLLLCIALFPLMHSTSHWWEHNSSKFMVAAGCAVVVVLYYAFAYGHGVVDHGTHVMSEPGIPAAVVILKAAILSEFVPFIVLLFALYVISGGINIAGSMRGTPMTNTTILLIGAVLASFVGTTGAAMVLIRPLLKANMKREKVAHSIVFFIFIVCNTGGCLLPIGDPPLFLGYLKGVPFFWTLALTPHWAFMNGVLLVAYYVYDSILYRSENKALVEALPDQPEPFALRGSINMLWMAGVILCAATLDPSKTFPGTTFTPPAFMREALLLGLVGLSLVTTPAIARKANGFNYNAIIEVAALFIGIFVCMQAPLQILNTYGSELGVDAPWKFYWCTGFLSSFLDNAPTYVVFFETAKVVPATSPLVVGIAEPIGTMELIAISLGAVFMGSMTYIGNGPNFMVKTIAEQGNVKMPSFFGYMGYSCAFVLPASILLTLIFFR